MVDRVTPFRERRACSECGRAHVGAYPRCISCFRAQRVGDNHEATSLVDVFGGDDFPESWGVRAR